MHDLLVNMAVLGALLAALLWLGTGYADWLLRTCRAAPAGSRSSTWMPAALLRVAVVDDEVLVELAPVGSATSPTEPSDAFWLCGRTDPARIAAMELRCGSPNPVRYCRADASHVVLDVGSVTVSMVGPAAGGATSS